MDQQADSSLQSTSWPQAQSAVSQNSVPAVKVPEEASEIKINEITLHATLFLQSDEESGLCLW